jgi:RNA polymerase sigma-70 factor (ECF subfamily)
MPLSPPLLAELIDSQAAALRSWVRSRCASPEDAVQEAFCRLAVQEPPPANPVAWLYGVARNVALKQRRSDQRREAREQTYAAQVNVAHRQTDALEMQEVLSAMNHLEDELRETLVAKLWGHLSFEEIGQAAGLSAATAFRRYQQALEQLRKRLGEKRVASRAS